MKLTKLSLLLIMLLGAVASSGAVCTQNGTVGATSSQVVAANDIKPRIYILIQNSGKSNGMHVAIGSSNAATTNDLYLAPGQSWVLNAPPYSQFAAPPLPPGDIAVIQDGGSTTYSFCDY